jgi:GT2 family glycosyltransferase
MSEVRVAAIIPVYEEPGESLARTLGALISQTSPPAAIVVVDDGSSRPPEIPSQTTKRVELLRLPRNVGVSCAMNTGAAATHTDYLLFIGCDVVLKPDWLERGTSYMEENPDVAVVTGVIVPVKGPKILREWRSQFLLTKVHRSALSEPEAQKWLDGHAMLVRRSVFDELHGFDERFRYSGEDWDFSQRVRGSGRTLFHLPKLVAECVDSTSVEYLARKTVRNSGWDLRPRSREPLPCAGVSPVRPLGAITSVLLTLANNSGRNVLRGRLRLLPVDMAVAARSLALVWSAWRS